MRAQRPCSYTTTMELFKELGIAWDLDKIRPFKVDGVPCWEKEYQDILHAGVWARHFPKAKYIHNGETILFYHNEPGYKGEILYRTQPIGGQGIERSVLDEYIDDLKQLIAYAQDKPKAMALLQQLQLPVPLYASERLRFYMGEDDKAHLAVMWGFIDEKENEVMPIIPIEEYARQFEEFVPDMRAVPKRSHVRLTLFVIAAAFALLVWVMARSGRVVEGPGMQPPDVEHDIAGALYVQPVGLVEKGEIVAARCAYKGTLDILGTRRNVKAGEVVYHRFDTVGNYQLSLWNDMYKSDNQILVAVREGGQPVPGGCAVAISPSCPIVGEEVHAVNCSPLPQDVKAAECNVRWDGGESVPIWKPLGNDGALELQCHVFKEPGMHKVEMEMKMEDGSIRTSQLEFPVFDARGLCPGTEATVLRPGLAVFPLSGTAFVRQNVYVCDVAEGHVDFVVDRLVNWGDGVGQHIPAGQHKVLHNYRVPGIYTIQLHYALKSGQRLYAETKLTVVERK